MNNIRNRHCISIQFNNGAKIQIILRLYNTLSEYYMVSTWVVVPWVMMETSLFHKFRQIWIRILSNVIHRSCRNTTYEKRLLKYYERGFNIIVPLLEYDQITA